MTIQDPARYTLTASEVAERLNCHRDTVRNLAESGELQFITRSRGSYDWRYFDPEEVAALAQKRGVVKNP